MRRISPSDTYTHTHEGMEKTSLTMGLHTCPCLSFESKASLMEVYELDVERV